MDLEKINGKELKAFERNVVNAIINGDINPLQAEIRLRDMANIIDKIRKQPQVSDAIMSEAYLHDKGEFFGRKIRIVLRNTPDYSNDTEWATLKAKMKARETLLKESGGIDPDTGEVVVIMKASEVLTIK